MTKSKLITPDATRRRLITGLGALGASTLLAGCDGISHNQTLQSVLGSAEHLTAAAQKLLASQQSLAREFDKSDISPRPKSNGTHHPQNPQYQKLAANNFMDWRLRIDGLVNHPGQFSLAQLRKMPARTQITRHDCVEGWSYIAGWTGVVLSHVLDLVQPKDNARFVVFHSADQFLGDEAGYYESLDMVEAYHPQTLLAYKLNGRDLPIPNGAPIRLRAPRQLGYKMAKYVMHIELVNSYKHIQGGKGGFWEDRGYQWWTGI